MCFSSSCILIELDLSTDNLYVLFEKKIPQAFDIIMCSINRYDENTCYLSSFAHGF